MKPRIYSTEVTVSGLTRKAADRIARIARDAGMVAITWEACVSEAERVSVRLTANDPSSKAIGIVSRIFEEVERAGLDEVREAIENA